MPKCFKGSLEEALDRIDVGEYLEAAKLPEHPNRTPQLPNNTCIGCDIATATPGLPVPVNLFQSSSSPPRSAHSTTMRAIGSNGAVKAAPCGRWRRVAFQVCEGRRMLRRCICGSGTACGLWVHAWLCNVTKLLVTKAMYPILHACMGVLAAQSPGDLALYRQC